MENINNNERYFDLSIILSIISGYLFTNIDNIYDVTSYITNVDVNAYNLLYSLRIAEFCILQRYPDLRTICKNISIYSINDTNDFVNKQKQIFGESLPLSPISQNVDEVYKPCGR